MMVEGSEVYSRCGILRPRTISISSQKGRSLSGGPEYHLYTSVIILTTIILILSNSYTEPKTNHKNMPENSLEHFLHDLLFYLTDSDSFPQKMLEIITL